MIGRQRIEIVFPFTNTARYEAGLRAMFCAASLLLNLAEEGIQYILTRWIGDGLDSMRIGTCGLNGYGDGVSMILTIRARPQ